MTRTPSDGSAVRGSAGSCDNVVLELQFLADHPGSVIERRPADPARAVLMRFCGRLGEQDGGGEVISTDLGDVLRRLDQLASGHAGQASGSLSRHTATGGNATGQEMQASP